MSQDTQDDALEAWENSGGQDRDMSEPANQAADEETPDLQAAIRKAYAGIDAGDVSSNYSARDSDFAAILRGLEEAGELEGVVEAANQELDRDHNPAAVSRSKALELLVRVGITEVRPEILDVAVDARTEYETDKIDADSI